jgi:hypothetical protein
MALEFWRMDEARKRFARGKLDVEGWRKLSDHEVSEK